MTSPGHVPGLIEPIRLSTRVRRGIEETFELFALSMTAWWPFDRFSFAVDRALEVHLEPFEGGRFYERYRDGQEHQIGEVLRWDPPSGITFTWKHADWAAPTEIDVRLIAEGTTSTRVELEHRSWDRLGAVGVQIRDQYLSGWPTVLACFTRAAGAA